MWSESIAMGLEFLTSHWQLRGTAKAVTVFGSARFLPSHRYSELARSVGRSLARHGFLVITGGGPGIMSAAHQGAKEAGGRTLGLNIHLPREQGPNAFVDRTITFRYFSSRKMRLMRYSSAFVFLPGGFGTLDELTEVLTLMRTGKMPPLPVYLVGTEYWKGLIQWLEGAPLAEGSIDLNDLKLITLTDDPDFSEPFAK